MVKKSILASVGAIALIGSGVLMATSPQAYQVPSKQHVRPMHQGVDKQKREQVRSIMKQYMQQIRPLKKQARVLRMQINGKMVTPGATWKDISGMNKQLSDLVGQIMELKTKARFDVYQKTGVILPSKSHHMKFGKRHHHPR